MRVGEKNKTDDVTYCHHCNTLMCTRLNQKASSTSASHTLPVNLSAKRPLLFAPNYCALINCMHMTAYSTYIAIAIADQ